jgi:ribosomal protein L37AE/L43A
VEEVARAEEICNMFLDKSKYEPVKHGRWVDRYGEKYANRLYECSECKGKALYKIEVGLWGKERIVQALSPSCPHCRAKMDLEDTK